MKLGAKKAWNKPRIYTIAADLVKAGTAVVAVRVNDTGYGGGMHGAPEEMYLSPSAETAGSWLERKRDWLRRSR